MLQRNVPSVSHFPRELKRAGESWLKMFILGRSKRSSNAWGRNFKALVSEKVLLLLPLTYGTVIPVAEDSSVFPRKKQVVGKRVY